MAKRGRRVGQRGSCSVCGSEDHNRSTCPRNTAPTPCPVCGDPGHTKNHHNGETSGGRRALQWLDEHPGATLREAAAEFGISH